ncbi:hypothetical protein RRG08_008035 [Elysia crispata]|uniref:Uncharacterized protein n=1 Tax=Elysia crispata TaxID=231223 RepID=A0AAE1AIR3_9GAST|nr:hypothetical protein RRG08_008035 [Elysia crispata]
MDAQPHDRTAFRPKDIIATPRDCTRLCDLPIRILRGIPATRAEVRMAGHYTPVENASASSWPFGMKSRRVKLDR